jgi:hypothetical protein
MAIIAVEEVWNGRMASRDIGNVREYRRTFRITTNNMQDGPFVVGNNNISGLPGLFTPYSDTEGNVDLGALCQKYTPRNSDDPFTWFIDVDYSSSLTRYEAPVSREVSGRTGKAEQAAAGAENLNPLLQPPVIQFSQARYQREIETWQSQVVYGNTTIAAGTPITNSANDPFDPPAIADYTRLVATYERNEARCPFAAMTIYQDVTNADNFWGAPPFCCKVNVNAQSAFTQGFFYWRVTYTLEFRFDQGAGGFIGTTIGWLKQAIDKGTRQLVNGAQTVIVDPNGQIVTTPVPLDGTGKALAISVQFSGGSPTTQARAFATVANGQITNVTLLTGGTGYSSAPTVSFSGGGGSGATATATVTNGAVTGVSLTNGGSGYSLTPFYTFPIALYPTQAFAPLQLIQPS